MHGAKERAGLLRLFQTPTVPSAESAQGLPDVRVLTGVSDPKLEEILERIWGPAWAFLSIEELEQELKRPETTRPGMKAALKRHRERQ